MAEGARTTRFQARVALERRFLTPVNARFGAQAPLAGMTLQAIESWEARAGRHFDPDVVASVVEILVEASRRAKLLVDDSREVFDPALREPSGMDDLVGLLKARIASAA
jgi:hypothetical protein